MSQRSGDWPAGPGGAAAQAELGLRATGPLLSASCPLGPRRCWHRGEWGRVVVTEISRLLATIWCCFSAPRPRGQRRCRLCRAVWFAPGACFSAQAGHLRPPSNPHSGHGAGRLYPKGGREDLVALSTPGPAWLPAATPGHPITRLFSFPPPPPLQSCLGGGRHLQRDETQAWGQKTALTQPPNELCDPGQVT